MKWVALILIVVGVSLLIVSLTVDGRPSEWERGDDDTPSLPLVVVIGVIVLLVGLTLMAISVFIGI